MKKLWVILTLCMLCICCAFGFTACGNTDPSHTHEYTDMIVEPTCTNDGYVLHLCSCGYYYKEDTAALGHDYKAEITEPSCTEQGFTSYTCSRCSDTYTDNYVAKIDHDYEWTTTKEPTETEDGIKTGVCKNCGDAITKIIPSFNHEHSYVETVIAPTCLTGGYTLHKCYCEDSYITDETPALGHNYGAANITREPTCTDNGERATTCSRCGDIKTQEIDALGHDYVSQTTVPTCIEQGYTTYTCSRCGNMYIDDYVPILGHNYQNETVAPTCTEQGYTAQTCTRCGDGYVVYTEMLGHIYGEPIVGNKVKNVIPNYYPITLICGRCGEEQHVSAYYKNKVSANCTNGGYTVYAYNYRNYVDGVETVFTTNINVEYVDALGTGGHVVAYGIMFYAYDIATQSPTYEYSPEIKDCFDSGLIRWNNGAPATCYSYELAGFTCTACGEQIVIALSGEHTFGEETVVPATCTADGYSYKTCANCDHRWVYDEVEATGHNCVYVYNSYDDGMASFRCTKCGEIIEQEVEFVSEYVAQDCRSRSYTTYQARITNGVGDNQMVRFNVYANGEILYHTVKADTADVQYLKYVAYNIAAQGPEYDYNDQIKSLFAEGFMRWSEGVPANCSYYLPAVFTCTVCNEQIVIALSGEHLGLDESNCDNVAPTCLESGMRKVYCVDCEKYILQAVYDGKGHNFAPNAASWSDFLALEDKNGAAVVFNCANCEEYITLYAKETITHSAVGCLTTDTYKYDFYTATNNTTNYTYQVKTWEGDVKTLTFKYSWAYNETEGTHLIGTYAGKQVRVAAFSFDAPEENRYEYYDAFDYFFDNGTIVWNEGEPATCDSYAFAIFTCKDCGEHIVFVLSGQHTFGTAANQTRIVDGHTEQYCTECKRWLVVG